MDEIKLFQVWRKNYEDSTFVEVWILELAEEYIVSQVIQSNREDRPVGKVMTMPLYGASAYDRKRNAFGWIPVGEAFV